MLFILLFNFLLQYIQTQGHCENCPLLYKYKITEKIYHPSSFSIFGSSDLWFLINWFLIKKISVTSSLLVVAAIDNRLIILPGKSLCSSSDISYNFRDPCILVLAANYYIHHGSLFLLANSLSTSSFFYAVLKV